MILKILELILKLILTLSIKQRPSIWVLNDQSQRSGVLKDLQNPGYAITTLSLKASQVCPVRQFPSPKLPKLPPQPVLAIFASGLPAPLASPYLSNSQGPFPRPSGTDPLLFSLTICEKGSCSC